MKANELMIGDWICIDEPDKYAGVTGQIQSLMHHREGDAAYFYVFIQGKFGYVSRDVCSDDIRPITLTPEILEKNGFVTNDEQGNWKGYRIYSLFNTDKSCIFMLKLYEKDSICEISLNMSPYYITFRYVHQLQHLLRLTGYDKEIVI